MNSDGEDNTDNSLDTEEVIKMEMDVLEFCTNGFISESERDALLNTLQEASHD